MLVRIFRRTSLPSPYPAEVLCANEDRAGAQYNRNGRQGEETGCSCCPT